MTRARAWIGWAVLAIGAVQGPGLSGSQRAAAQTQSAASPAQAAGDLTGNWQGTLALGNGQRVLIKVTKEGAQGAAYKGTLYLIDGGGRAAGLPSIAVHGTDISFAIA